MLFLYLNVPNTSVLQWLRKDFRATDIEKIQILKYDCRSSEYHVKMNSDNIERQMMKNLKWLPQGI